MYLELNEIVMEGTTEKLRKCLVPLGTSDFVDMEEYTSVTIGAQDPFRVKEKHNHVVAMIKLAYTDHVPVVKHEEKRG